MSLLVVDAGNTRVRLAVAADGGLRKIVEFPTAELSEGRLPSAAQLGPVSSVRVAAVGDVERVLETWSYSVLGVPFERLTSPRSGDGLINAYAERSQDLGVDRWLAMLAARQRVGGSLLVVDAGTAMTLDAVDDEGRHLGGYIVPGLQLARRSLGSGTAALPEAMGTADHGLAKGTEGAILGGTVAELAALITRVHADLAPGTVIVITGGDAVALLPAIEMDPMHVPDLVLEGLANCRPSEWAQ